MRVYSLIAALLIAAVEGLANQAKLEASAQLQVDARGTAPVPVSAPANTLTLASLAASFDAFKKDTAALSAKSSADLAACAAQS